MEQNQPPTTPQQMPQKKNKKRLIIGLIIIAAALILIGIVGLININKKNTTNNSAISNSSVYYDRPGYDRKTLGETIGDPFAITMSAKKETQTLSDGTKVIPACGIVTLLDIQKENLKLLPNNYGTPIIQNYLSKSGKAAFSPEPLMMPTASDTLSCTYGLTTDQSIGVSVNQAFTTTQQAVNDYAGLPGFTTVPETDGWSVAKRTKDDTVYYLLRKGTDTVLLTFKLRNNSAIDVFVKQAIAHLNSFGSMPTGVSDIAFTSPTFSQKYARSCDYITNDDLKQLTSHDMSPLVQEMWPSATGVITSGKDGGKQSNYIRNQCIRTANVGDSRLVGINNHTLRIAVTSYKNDKAASDGLVKVSIGEGNDSKIKGSEVGEEAYLYKSASLFEKGQNVLAFRQGRFVVELMYDFAKQENDPSTADLSQYGEKLSPLGKVVATKLQHL